MGSTTWTHCKQCSSPKIVKNGNQDGIQRYKCKACGAVFRGQEEKYSSAFKLEAIKMYLHSMSIRAIAQVKQVHHSVIAYWIKKSGEVAKEAFYAEVAKVTETKMQILELDELFTYVKKNPAKHMYFLQCNEKSCELLICM